MEKNRRRTISYVVASILTGTAIGIAAVESESSPSHDNSDTQQITVKVPSCVQVTNGAVLVSVELRNGSDVEHTYSFGAKVFEGSKTAHSVAQTYTIEPGSSATHTATIPPNVFAAGAQFHCDIYALKTLK